MIHMAYLSVFYNLYIDHTSKIHVAKIYYNIYICISINYITASIILYDVRLLLAGGQASQGLASSRGRCAHAIPQSLGHP